MKAISASVLRSTSCFEAVATVHHDILVRHSATWFAETCLPWKKGFQCDPTATKQFLLLSSSLFNLNNQRLIGGDYGKSFFRSIDISKQIRNLIQVKACCKKASIKPVDFAALFNSSCPFSSGMALRWHYLLSVATIFASARRGSSKIVLVLTIVSIHRASPDSRRFTNCCRFGRSRLSYSYQTGLIA
jgi:hypothetical protein